VFELCFDYTTTYQSFIHVDLMPSLSVDDVIFDYMFLSHHTLQQACCCFFVAGEGKQKEKKIVIKTPTEPMVQFNRINS
jgi:hypothetical protein